MEEPGLRNIRRTEKGLSWLLKDPGVYAGTGWMGFLSHGFTGVAEELPAAAYKDLG